MHICGDGGAIEPVDLQSRKQIRPFIPLISNGFMILKTVHSDESMYIKLAFLAVLKPSV